MPLQSSVPLLTLICQIRLASTALLQHCSSLRNQNSASDPLPPDFATHARKTSEWACLSRISASPGRSRQSVLNEYTVTKQRPSLLGCQPDPLFLQSRFEDPPPSDSAVWELQIMPQFSPVRIKLRHCCCGHCLDDQPCWGPVPPPDQFGPLAWACLLTPLRPVPPCFLPESSELQCT